MPPTNACEDEDGNPNHHVIRFQAMAPTRAHPTTSNASDPTSRAMIPSPTVEATFSPKKEPSRFPTAAMSRAERSVSARVDTDVAMALAES